MEQTAALVALFPEAGHGRPALVRMEGTPEAVAEMEAKRRSEVLVLHIPAAAPVEGTAAGGGD